MSKLSPHELFYSLAVAETVRGCPLCTEHMSARIAAIANAGSGQMSEPDLGDVEGTIRILSEATAECPIGNTNSFIRLNRGS